MADGPHPAVAKGRRHLTEALTDVGPGDRVEVALSGGADSLALAACLAFVGPKAGWDCTAVVVDHRLQENSAEVAAAAAQQASALGLAADVVPVEVGSAGGPEAAAREARYAALLARPVDATLLAHTLDDQAETVLLGLGRGSGPRAIAGMPASAGQLRRPFLRMRRSETEQICVASGLAFWSDPHNLDDRFRRSRLRNEVLPLLEEVLGGGVAEALSRTATQVRSDVEFIDDIAASLSVSLIGAFAEGVDVTKLASLEPALRLRILRLAALEAGAPASHLSAAHLDELDRLVMNWHGQVRVELPGRISAVRDGEALRFIPTPVAG